MSVEAALAARRRQSAADTDGVDAHGAVGTDETGLLDLERLAAQREHAVRAAVIGQRVAERRRLEQSNADGIQRVGSDPFTGAMKQLRDPQAEKDLANTGIRGPQTSGFRLELAPGTGAPSETAPRASSPGPREPPPAAAGRADTPLPAAGATPLRADKAQGLDPLDYLTAGVRRANRLALVVLGSLVLGGAALVTGLILIVNSR